MLGTLLHPLHRHCPYTGLSRCFCPEGAHSSSSPKGIADASEPRHSAAPETTSTTNSYRNEPILNAKHEAACDGRQWNGASVGISGKSTPGATNSTKTAIEDQTTERIFKERYLLLLNSEKRQAVGKQPSIPLASEAVDLKKSNSSLSNVPRPKGSTNRPEFVNEECAPNGFAVPESLRCEMNVSLTTSIPSTSTIGSNETLRGGSTLQSQGNAPKKTQRDDKIDVKSTTISPTENRRVSAPDTEDEDERFEPMCHFRNCRNEKDKAELLVCMKCRRAFHASCCDPPLKYGLVTRYPWSCTECKACKICGSNMNEDTMLICDVCDRACHMECMSPPVKKVPEEEWFCPECGSCHCCNRLFEYDEAMDTSSFYFGRFRLCTICAEKYISRQQTKRIKSRSTAKIEEEDTRLCSVCVTPLYLADGDRKADTTNSAVKCSACCQYTHTQCHVFLEDDPRWTCICKVCNELHKGCTA